MAIARTAIAIMATTRMDIAAMAELMVIRDLTAAQTMGSTRSTIDLGVSGAALVDVTQTIDTGTATAIDLPFVILIRANLERNRKRTMLERALETTIR